MDLSSFDYVLPPDRIAQNPATQRDHSRLLVADRQNHSLHDRVFYQVTDYFSEGDVLVLNDTFVFPARLYGTKDPGGAHIEMLLLEKQMDAHWQVIAYRASRLHVGTIVRFGHNFYCQVAKVLEEGKFIVKFHWDGDWDERLKKHGEIPLPPYIEREEGHANQTDKERYQTVFAQQSDLYNSAAAPTAGLHFTPEILRQLKEKNVLFCPVTLRVGLDTFLPMRSHTIEEHTMHTEAYHLPPESASRIEEAWSRGKRIIAVGTTAMRVLESAAYAPGKLRPGENRTNLFIYPGFPFKIVNTMITNFHLPRTTLILLVSSFMGSDFRAHAYQHAINHQYRFFSYGDAMLIL